MIRRAWLYDDKEHWTMQDLINTILDIEEEDDAEDFMEEYSLVCDHAENMVGYMCWLIGKKEGQEVKEDLLDLFMVDERRDYINWGFGNPQNDVQYSSLGIKHNES